MTHFTKCADNIEPTTAEAKNRELTKQRKHKQHNDCQLCNLNFCTIVHCSATFETFDELESHIVKGIHSVPKAALSFDYVRKSFANQMIVAARFLFICNILSNSFSFQCIWCCYSIVSSTRMGSTYQVNILIQCCSKIFSLQGI